MKVITPLELSVSERTLEHDRKFYWVASVKMHVSLSSGKVKGSPEDPEVESHVAFSGIENSPAASPARSIAFVTFGNFCKSDKSVKSLGATLCAS